MGKIICVVGSSGVGKTTLANALRACFHSQAGLENHTERPFQELFRSDKTYGLANQIDYLLFRADQEFALRSLDSLAVVDGGLDQDYHGFTRLFYQKGFLSPAEYDLCKRFYDFARKNLGDPDLVIHLYASDKVVESRLLRRNRINIANSTDNAFVENCLSEWAQTLLPSTYLKIDVSSTPSDYQPLVERIYLKLQEV